jgi:hypothetical protein
MRNVPGENTRPCLRRLQALPLLLKLEAVLSGFISELADSRVAPAEKLIRKTARCKYAHSVQHIPLQL